MNCKNINLARLPAWLRYTIAGCIAAIVMLVGWRVGASRPEPEWLGPLRTIWTVLGPLLVVFFVVKWFSGRKRRQRAQSLGRGQFKRP